MSTDNLDVAYKPFAVAQRLMNRDRAADDARTLALTAHDRACPDCKDQVRHRRGKCEERARIVVLGRKGAP